jgi:DNA-binding IclR family transcriptional regulator
MVRTRRSPSPDAGSGAAPEPPAGGSPRLLACAGEGKLTTLSRGLSILEFVARSERFVRLRDVAEHFGLDRSAALRFLRTLEADGYLARHEAMKLYSIGPKLLSFPRVPAGVERIVEAARPVLIELALAAGQMSHLAVLTGSQAALVEVVASNAPVSVKQAVGDLEPLNSSAVGKALYSFLPEAERRRLAQRIDFVPHTSRTITDLAALEAEAREIRVSGIAFDRNEGNDQVCCLGCPILDAHGAPLASIGLSYVAAHLPRPIDEMADDIARTLAAARQVEASLSNAAG